MTTPTLQTTDHKMQKTVEALKSELTTIRTGRAAPALVENIKVEYGGVPMPLNQLATISAPEARLLIIQPWDRSSVNVIEKSIMKSDLGLTPISDGTMIRISIPPLSEERRREMIKTVHKRLEEKKIALRNIRREAQDDLKKMEKDKDISQDDLKRALDQLQKLTDAYSSKADQVCQAKEKELTEI